MTRSLVVVTAGLSQPSSTRLLADRLAEASAARLRSAGQDVRVTVLELRDLAHDLTDHLLTGFGSPRLVDALDEVSAADGLVVVTPIFSASYSGLFKTFIDVLEEGALADKPVLVAATGGTARHSLALEFAVRPLFAYLRATVAPTAVFAATEDFGGSTGGTTLSSRVERAANELSDLVRARPVRTAVSQVDAFDVPTPFTDLLHSH